MNESVKEKFIISRIYGAFYEIYSPVSQFHPAVLKGKFRLRDKEERHPFVVGDIVDAEPSSGKEWIITKLYERKNSLARKSDLNDTHVLCSNVDYLLILASMNKPATKDNFIDRCLVACYYHQIEPIILLSKSDLVEEELVVQREAKYRDLGYTIFSYNYQQKEKLNPLSQLLNNKVTYICGNSGVGKSTFINLVMNKDLLKTGLISESTGKGKHTTTNSSLVLLDSTTYLIDSPGIKEWGLLHLTPYQIWESFPELSVYKNDCDSIECCNGSKNCNILLNLEEAPLSAERRKSLEAMLQSLQSPEKYKGNLFTRKTRR